MMYPSEYPPLTPGVKRLSPIIGAVIIATAAIGYAVHEHHAARCLAAQNQQVTTQLAATHIQLDTLSSKVNALIAGDAVVAQPVTSASPHTGIATTRRPDASHRASDHSDAYDPRFKELQSQSAQGKTINQSRSDLESTRNDLTGARTEPSGSIARTHGELVLLEKKGERSYFEFDLTKSKDFKHEGPVSISLRKADTKHGFADLALIVGDRNLTQKHVNLYLPTMFYRPDSHVPVEVVINDISKNHIHGYVSTPKYRTSQLASTSDAGASSASNTDQAASAQPASRQRLPLPDEVDEQ